MIYIIILLFILIIFYSFSSKVSPIPYFPTNKADLDKIVKAFNMKNDGVVLDLGAGNGTVIFAAAKKAYEKRINTQFYAIDINIFLILYMWVRRLFHPNKSNIKLVYGDIFKVNYKNILKKYSHVVFYIYISPWFTAVTHQIIKEQKIKAQIVSYFYPIENAKEDQKIKGVHNIYIYKAVS